MKIYHRMLFRFSKQVYSCTRFYSYFKTSLYPSLIECRLLILFFIYINILSLTLYLLLEFLYKIYPIKIILREVSYYHGTKLGICLFTLIMDIYIIIIMSAVLLKCMINKLNIFNF